MTVTVVPVLRLRRATTGWSYKVPSELSLQVGALVIVPFRGHPTLGVVWDAEPNKKATLAVTEALTLTPLVRAPHRRLIEWLSEEGICSLSTALYVWLPAALRHLPLTKSVREALASWDANQPTALEVAKLKQHLILTPSQREDAEASLRVKYDKAFTSTFLDTTPAQEFTTWLAIAQGRCTLASGRERALYAPWVNLRHCTVIEPEDISFHSGQSPYVNLVDAALVLAEASKAEPTLRTNLPVNAAQRVWPAAQSFPLPQTTVELTDLRKERLLNEPLLRSIRHTVAQLHHVVILYNAHDRPRLNEDGTRSIIPGIETIRKQLLAALDPEGAPYIHVGTRTILEHLPRPIGLAVALSLDPLMHQEGLLDRMHGWGDLGRLIRTAAPLIVQTRTPEHPFVQALVHNQLAAYCEKELSEAKQLGLQPFSEEIVCAVKVGTTAVPTPEALTEQLQTLAPTPWRVSHPREASRRGTRLTIISLHAPKGTRVPQALRSILAALPRPWKVERGPWYAA